MKKKGENKFQNLKKSKKNTISRQILTQKGISYK